MAKNHSVTKRNRRNVGKTRVKVSRDRIQRTMATLVGAVIKVTKHHSVIHDGPCPQGCGFLVAERAYERGENR